MWSTHPLKTHEWRRSCLWCRCIWRLPSKEGIMGLMLHPRRTSLMHDVPKTIITALVYLDEIFHFQKPPYYRRWRISWVLGSDASRFTLNTHFFRVNYSTQRGPLIVKSRLMNAISEGQSTVDTLVQNKMTWGEGG